MFVKPRNIFQKENKNILKIYKKFNVEINIDV
nr:MAG TPA: hypothetical protein [Caudoviricetes sp.]